MFDWAKRGLFTQVLRTILFTALSMALPGYVPALILPALLPHGPVRFLLTAAWLLLVMNVPRPA